MVVVAVEVVHKHNQVVVLRVEVEEVLIQQVQLIEVAEVVDPVVVMEVLAALG
tara:strand:+ start:340 stop:498 length:159 start_codon:yes stop_codon:yes gene_type:complete